MNKQYLNPEWKTFRHEVMELDGHKCTRCKRNASSEVILQVHHKKYIRGMALWDYPLHLCETLCKRCHAAEHGKIKPSSGWKFIRQEDLGKIAYNCENCGKDIRHKFYIQHPSWHPMIVGTVCSDKLTNTKKASNIQKFHTRLRRFIDSARWQVDGDKHTILQKDLCVTIASSGNAFIIQIEDTRGTRLYPTLKTAKRRVFEFISSGQATDFFANLGKL